MPDILNMPLDLPCGAVLPNRLCKAALTEGLADPRNRATAAHERLYRRWSEGGAGLILTGNVLVDRRYLERPGNVVIDGPQDGEAMAALRAYGAAGTVAGNQLWMQLNHAGRQTPKSIATEPVAPSAVALDLPGDGYGVPRALTHEEILDIVARFAHAAGVAEEAGFTGVQIHAAHGYLISEFLSPAVNRREDDWGGTTGKRARLLIEVIRAVRARVGTDFAVSVKLNSADFQKGGFSFEDCKTVVGLLNAEAVDLLEISGGTYEQPRMMGGKESAYREGLPESTRLREAYFLAYAAEIARVATMPLMVTGGFRNRAAMVEAIEQDGISVIGLGRPLCVEPDFPRLLLSGESDGTIAWERRLREHPGPVDSAIPADRARAMLAWGIQGWFCLQLLRMGAGDDPDEGLGVIQAFRDYAANERAAAAALIRTGQGAS
ncbi:NADH:flavin oxidoreductase/NADH oxidase family protein [Oceanibacterium hippocampi]|uniref:NADH oxidase n=1 Tax=Oceanibacterium hippocampi TaxID=745714 RepID=A0A1Y5TVT4_9PROT|nr:NADH:flavin oxidoreductase/NADH oxidase family protein [Oceanibacterium hippocampi]SLN69334.1 NADH oxidase [Oceanibacterium hippocampi]